MTQSKPGSNAAKMLELWRPPTGAGDAIGCLTSTFTFSPGLFDEQCLARFLRIDSEPDREDLAFLLERETRLGGAYAGVLVDYTQAGVEHSLRWDVLPVRIPGAKQHAKLSILAWTNHARIIVTSANLSESGYRANFEVAAAIDLAADEADQKLAGDAISFLHSLVGFVPNAEDDLPATMRAFKFLNAVEKRIRAWKPVKKSEWVGQRLICTLPAGRDGQTARGALEEAVTACRGRRESPNDVWAASPFFDVDAKTNRAAAALCKSMGRGVKRDLRLCVPQLRDSSGKAVARLLAPKSLWSTPQTYNAKVAVEALPDLDDDKNRRPWHAKMFMFRADGYTALMIGSSNFTCAGLGLIPSRNAEANLLTIADRVDFGRETGKLEDVWPDTEEIGDPESAEWLGVAPESVEEEQGNDPPLPLGFLSATYRAGDVRQVTIKLDAAQLPKDWQIRTVGAQSELLLSAMDWTKMGSLATVDLNWASPEPPGKLRVLWDNHEAFLPLNVEDSRQLPAPTILATMTADDMLAILAAADPSAAFRAWSAQHAKSAEFEDGLDTATPIDLDPLRRHDIRETFLHRIRRRARVFAQMRANLERPVWGQQQLEWRLRGMIGVEPLAHRYAQEAADLAGDKGEALLTLSDLLMVLHEVKYQPIDGAMTSREFEAVYRPFLSELTVQLKNRIAGFSAEIDSEIRGFWGRVVAQCRG